MCKIDRATFVYIFVSTGKFPVSTVVGVFAGTL